MYCSGKVYVGVSKQRVLKLPVTSLTVGVGAKVSHYHHPYCAGETEAREHRDLLNNIWPTSGRGGSKVQHSEALLAGFGPSSMQALVPCCLLLPLMGIPAYLMEIPT